MLNQSWLPDPFIERAYQTALQAKGPTDELVLLSAFEASAIRVKYQEINAPGYVSPVAPTRIISFDDIAAELQRYGGKAICQREILQLQQRLAKADYPADCLVLAAQVVEALGILAIKVGI